MTVWTGFTVIGIACVPLISGYAASHGLISAVDSAQRLSIIFLFLTAWVTVVTLVWSIRLLNLRSSVIVYALGAVLNAAVTTSSWQGNPWKYAFSWPVTVLVLAWTFGAERRRSYWALALLIVISAADSYRSGFGFIVVVATLTWVRNRWRPRRRHTSQRRRGRSGLALVVVLVAVYLVGSYGGERPTGGLGSGRKREPRRRGRLA